MRWCGPPPGTPTRCSHLVRGTRPDYGGHARRCGLGHGPEMIRHCWSSTGGVRPVIAPAVRVRPAAVARPSSRRSRPAVGSRPAVRSWPVTRGGHRPGPAWRAGVAPVALDVRERRGRNADGHRLGPMSGARRPVGRRLVGRRVLRGGRPGVGGPLRWGRRSGCCHGVGRAAGREQDRGGRCGAGSRGQADQGHDAGAEADLLQPGIERRAHSGEPRHRKPRPGRLITRSNHEQDDTDESRSDRVLRVKGSGKPG